MYGGDKYVCIQIGPYPHLNISYLSLLLPPLQPSLTLLRISSYLGCVLPLIKQNLIIRSQGFFGGFFCLLLYFFFALFLFLFLLFSSLFSFSSFFSFLLFFCFCLFQSEFIERPMLIQCSLDRIRRAKWSELKCKSVSSE